MSRFLVTGASGFVGSALRARLTSDMDSVVAIGRHAPAEIRRDGDSTQWVSAGADFIDLADRANDLPRCDVAVHLAARVHQMHESAIDSFAAYRETNVTASLRVAQAAARAGVQRFIFISSIKAMGEQEPGQPPHPWRESDAPTPSDPYGITKAEAETTLAAFCAREGIEFVVLRPPLIYGPGVRANFLQLLSIVGKRVPLPLASVKAMRSMVFIDNFVDAIVHSSRHLAANGRRFHVTDGQDFTIAEIVRILGAGMERPARMIPAPPAVLAWLARLVGKAAQADRLLRPLRVDSRAIQTELGWCPPVAAKVALGRTAVWYRDVYLRAY